MPFDACSQMSPQASTILVRCLLPLGIAVVFGFSFAALAWLCNCMKKKQENTETACEVVAAPLLESSNATAPDYTPPELSMPVLHPDLDDARRQDLVAPPVPVQPVSPPVLPALPGLPVLVRPVPRVAPGLAARARRIASITAPDVRRFVQAAPNIYQEALARGQADEVAWMMECGLVRPPGCDSLR